MIALALITRDKKEDVKLLRRLLDNIEGYVDGIFITAADKTFEGHVKKICAEYKAHYSEFKWINDFSAARNFNFKQVPKEYEYIMWSDVDDMWRGLENLPVVLKENKDAYAFWYLYDFDDDKQPVVAHKKTMIVRNDGSFEWEGRIHEDITANRDVSIGFSTDMDRMHFTNEERIEEARDRNEKIAKEAYEADKNDPRNHFNYGNALIGSGKANKALGIFNEFLKTSESDSEKYLIRQKLSSIYYDKGMKEDAVRELQTCIGMQPSWPDAYLSLGQFFFDMGNLDQSERYLLYGLALKPVYNSMIVFNPRDYDYNPMNLLAKVYFRKSRPDKALPLLRGCLEINPRNERMQTLVKEMDKEVKELQKILGVIEELKKIEDKDKLKAKIDSLPIKQRSHPGVCAIYNQNFYKTECSDKDFVIYCGFTEHEWNPELFRTKGFGGSEEAIIHLSQHLAKNGYNVEVYANIGSKRVQEGNVLWKPFWEFNIKDATNHMLLWRSPKMCDYDLNAKNIYVDVHDVISPGEFTESRLKKIKKIFVKTKFHKSLFPNVPDEKFAVIPNGINTSDFKPAEKYPNLIINTSSPDRSMEAAAEIFKRVKKEVPEASFQWAYGWDVFDSAHAGDQKMMKWKNDLVQKMDEAGVEQLGKIPQHEIANLYAEAHIMLYPTEFAEIDCISVKKAQLAGCLVVSTDFGALDESVQHGIKIHSSKTGEDWCKPYQFSFGVEKEEQIQQFADTIIKELKVNRDTAQMVEFGKSFDWSIIGDKWIKEINGN